MLNCIDDSESRFLVWMDEKVDPQGTILAGIKRGHVVFVPDPGNFQYFRCKGFRNTTDNHIKFIAIGNSNQGICLLYMGFS